MKTKDVKFEKNFNGSSNLVEVKPVQHPNETPKKPTLNDLPDIISMFIIIAWVIIQTLVKFAETLEAKNLISNRIIGKKIKLIKQIEEKLISILTITQCDKVSILAFEFYQYATYLRVLFEYPEDSEKTNKYYDYRKIKQEFDIQIQGNNDWQILDIENLDSNKPCYSYMLRNKIQTKCIKKMGEYFVINVIFKKRNDFFWMKDEDRRKQMNNICIELNHMLYQYLKKQTLFDRLFG